MTIRNGGKLNSSSSMDVGLNGGSSGTVTVTGGGSQLNLVDYLELGFLGTGTLDISDDGLVTSQDGYLGNRAGAKGTGNVTTGGTWNNSRDLFVGYQGEGTLNLASGGTVTSQTTTLGFYGEGVGKLTVDGAGSFFSTEGFIVGRLGVGEVIATNGGKMESASGIIGEEAGSTGSVTIDTGASWDVDGALTIGALGNGTLNLASGGTLDSQIATIGRNAGGVGTVTVSGTGTEWNNAGAFVIGRAGSGTMTLTGGAVVNSGEVTVGAENVSTGNLTISNGGYWNSTGAMTVGLNGHGTMLVDDGVLLTNGGKIGVGFGADGAVELANGGVWNAQNGTVTVGGSGGSGALTLNAGTLSAQKLVLAAVGAGASADVAINAQSSVNIAGIVEIASVSGSSGTMAVSGTDAVLTIGGTLGVGHIGDGTLLIENGGKAIVNNAVRIGFGSDATGAVTVRGAGSQLETSTSLRVGFEGNGSLTVENGGHVLSNGGTLALGAGSTGTALVTGSGSLWDARGVNAFQVGGQGNGASLTVTDGALLQASKVHVGGFSGASSNVMTVSGGARVESLDAFVGGTAGQSGTVLVTGAGTEWAATGNFTVGGAADGRMTLADGGVLNSQGGAIGGASAGNTGTGEVLVTGAGSIWNVGDPKTYELRVGDAGIGLLRVENGGVVNGRVQVGQYGELSGNGTIIGNTILTGTGKLWGTQGETLTFGGDLRINSALSNINVALGTPGNATPLFDVAGDLTIDGTLNVTDAGGFGQGVYRIFDYGGTLTDNGLDVGTMPSGTSGTVQTAVAHQVNLLVSDMADDTRFWNGTTTTADGTIHGGSGTWRVGPTNWTDVNGSAAAAWGGQFAVFQNNPGTVTVDGSAGMISTSGMQFIGTGWNVAGDAITLNGAGGNTTIRVGDGTGAGASHTATIASVLAGNSRLVKDDLGTLILTGTNTYTGGTQINAGTLQIGNDGADGSVTGNIVNNAALAFNHSGSKTYDGVISGTGALSLDAGQLVLTGANTYSGGTNIASGARLRIGDGILSGSITGNVVANGDLRFNNPGATSFGGAISGSGRITQTSGTLTLTGNSSGFTGVTRVQGGTLGVDGMLGGSDVFVSGAALGGTGSIAGTVTMQAAGVLEGAQGQTLTMGALVLAADSNVNVALGAPDNGTGLFNVTGDLTLDGTLNVANAGGFGDGVYRIFDYGGTLTDNGLDIGTMPAGTSGTVQTAVAQQVNLLVSGAAGDTQFWNGTTSVADGTVHGGAGTWSASPTTNWTDANGMTAAAWGGQFAVFQNNPAAVTVDGSAGAVVTTGMQFIGTGWTVGGDAITLNGAGGNTTVRVGDGTAAGASHTATIASELAGSSRLVKDDLGTLILAGANTYSGGTQINNGVLQIGNGGTSGSITGDVLNNAVLAFNRSDATTFAGTITGSGAVRLMNGDLTLTADNTYTGPTSIAAGATLRLGNGGTTGGIVGDVDTAGTFVFNRSNSFDVAGAISGAGVIRQVGSGLTNLTGNSGAFTGTTRVENGTLAVNGTLGGTVEILGDGRLQGAGTVGNTIVGSVIAPGNSIGTLNVAGDITFNAGSIYEIEVNAAGQSDRIVATGAATINGGTVQVLAGMGTYAPATTYTILTADGGRSGTFTGGVTSNLAFLDPSLSYDANNVYLTMTRNDISFQNVGITPNQIVTGGAVESLGLGNSVHDAVLNLSAPQAQYAFDQLSGEIHASARTALIEDSRFIRNAVNDRIRAAFDRVGASTGNVVTYVDGKPVAVPATTDRLAVWGEAIGSWGHTDGDGNAARLDRSTGGFFIGADAPVFDTWRFGAVGGHSRTDFDVQGRQSSGDSDNYHVGLYGGTQRGLFGGDLAFRTGAAYTWHDVSTARNVIFPGFGNSLKGDYNAATAQVFGELAYGFSAGGARFEPFVNLAYVNLHTDGFRETGGAAALTSPSANTDATFTTLGLRGATSFDMGGATLTAKGMVGWRHAFGDVTPDAVMRFAGGGSAFTIAGVPIARDAAAIEAGLDYAITPDAILGIAYGGQFGAGAADQSVKANLNVRF